MADGEVHTLRIQRRDVVGRSRVDRCVQKRYLSLLHLIRQATSLLSFVHMPMTLPVPQIPYDTSLVLPVYGSSMTTLYDLRSRSQDPT